MGQSGRPPKNLFEMALIVEAGTTSLRLAGELDLYTAPGLRRELERALDHPQNVVVDASALTFCDSAGISALVWAYNMARAHRTAFRIENAQEAVRRIFELSGLHRMLE